MHMNNGYYTSEIVGFSVYGNTFATLFTHYSIVWTGKRLAVGTRVRAMFKRGLL